MKLLFQQRYFSWFDSYDIYDADGNIVYVINGKLSLGHSFNIYNSSGDLVAGLKEEIFHLFHQFQMKINDQVVGKIEQRFSFFSPRLQVSLENLEVDGDLVGFNYEIRRSSLVIATVHKEILHFTDTYVIDIKENKDQLKCLLLVLAIDAILCQRG